MRLSHLAIWIFLTFLFGAGCGVEIDRYEYSFDVSQSMDGTLEIRVINVHPLEYQDKHKSDAIEFCSSGYREEAREAIKRFQLTDSKTQVVRHTEDVCDVIVEGEFRSFPAILTILFSDSEYEIRRTRTSLDVNVPPSNEEPEEAELSASLSIRYASTIIDTNAEKLAKDKGAMEWSISYLLRYGMRFRLAMPDLER